VHVGILASLRGAIIAGGGEPGIARPVRDDFRKPEVMRFLEAIRKGFLTGFL